MGASRTSICLMVSSLALALAMPSCAWAQDAKTQPNSAPESAEIHKTFLPQDFEKFAPRSANDMVRQIPGFTVREGDQERGLGEASANVIVDGARLSGKSDGLDSQLQRIPANRVVRIELVDGAALGIPGLTGQVANVITRKGGISGQFEYVARFRAHYAWPQWLGGEASVSGSKNDLVWSVALSNKAGRGASGGPTLVTDGAGVLLERRDSVFKLRDDDPKIIGKIKWGKPGGAVGNVSAMYRQGYFKLLDRERREQPGTLPFKRIYRERFNVKEHEFNADYEFALGPGRLKLIALEQAEKSRYRETSRFNFSDARPDSGDLYMNADKEGERIGRGEYSWKMLGGDWQLAAEGAFNRLDRTAWLGEFDSAGTETSRPFPEGSGGVREDRYEAILTHGRSLSRNLTVRLGIGGEYSKLSQTGPDGLSRNFLRPKGSLTLAWDPSKLVDVSVKLERKVGQLDFGDFLAAVFLDDDNSNTANARLVPAQAWEAEVETKFDLGAWGSTNLRLFGDRTVDLVDVIPLANLSGEYRGNLPPSTGLGAEWKGTFKLDRAGFAGAQIESEAMVKKSRLRDPLSGKIRGRSQRALREIRLSLRHDVPKTDWAWSLGAEHFKQSQYYRLRETGVENEGPVYIYGFVENKDVLGATLRLTVFNLNGGRRTARRTVHAGPRDRTPIVRNELTDERIGPLFNLSLKGNF
jgi:TonB-dependent Receptor Plug Domain